MAEKIVIVMIKHYCHSSFGLNFKPRKFIQNVKLNNVDRKNATIYYARINLRTIYELCTKIIHLSAGKSFVWCGAAVFMRHIR